MSRDALVVGINTYQNLPNLQAPAQDAEAVARCLESFGECRVVRLPEAITQQKPAISQRGGVTTAMLEAALIKLFKPAGKNIPQTAIFFYSGHGLQRQAGIQEGYLATSDVNPAAGQYGLSLHWLRRLLQESPVRQRVILLDCCNSGEFFNMLEADPGAKAGTDRLFMAAAREYEAAYESLSGGHSVFTEALLSGLNPYKVKGGIVNGHSLTELVNRKLKGELQQPLFESSGGEIVLTRISGLISSPRELAPPLLERLEKLRFGFCPFPGAAPFEAAHSEFFFGREEITQTLVDRVQTSRCCALVGASGSGKTSLLKAGLMPRLNAATDHRWTVRYLALGTSPLASLAEVFVDAGATGLQRAEQMRRAESFLQQGVEGFLQLVLALVASPGPEARLVLVLDQFEALLNPATACEADCRLVIDCLTAALQQEHIPLHIVLGLRAHQYPNLAAFPEFQALVAEHSLVLPTMSYNQLKATIVGPLEKVGLRYDTNLVYTLLLEVVSAPADLALLQLILKELWARREATPNAAEPPRLTLAAYVEMGGIRHLLNQRAGDLYAGLSSQEQAIAQRIFLSLCDIGDGTTLTRRAVTLDELVTEAVPESVVVATLAKLLAARLVVAQAQLPGPGDTAASLAVPGWSPAAAGSGAPLVTGSLLVASPLAPAISAYFDIGHEALIRNWPLLQQWLQAEGTVIRQQQVIESAAQAWQQQPTHPDYFLTKTRLNEAKTFRKTHPEQLSVLASSYLDACDRYSRRCGRQRHLVRLLIPLSMATGMLTAYGHSHLSHPKTTLTLATAPTAPISDLAPTLELLPPAAAGEMATTALGSPQVGIVGTNLLHLRKNPFLPALPSQSLVGAAPWLRAALDKAEQGLSPLAMVAKTLGPVPAVVAPPAAVPQAPAASQPMPPVAPSLAPALPVANQVVELEAWWVDPRDPSAVIQIWCTRGQAQPVCFTSTAAREPLP